MGLGSRRPALGARRTELQRLDQAAGAARLRGRHGQARAADALHAQLGHEPLRRAAERTLDGRRLRGRRGRDRGRRPVGQRRGRGDRRPAAGRAAGGRGRRRRPGRGVREPGRRRRGRFAARPEFHVRELRGRRLQPAGARRRLAGGGLGDAACELQPALPLRKRRPRQDASDARHRVSDPPEPAGPQGRLPVGRTLHEPLRAGASGSAHHRIQGPLPVHRCPAARGGRRRNSSTRSTS